MNGRRYLIVGCVLMILLGLARGIGGLVLLARGAAADPKIQAAGAAVSAIGVVLLVLGSALIMAAVGVLRRVRSCWFVGVVCTVAFVVDGAINGVVLYGGPGGRGTAVNVIAAGLILACLFSGKSALLNGAARR